MEKFHKNKGYLKKKLIMAADRHLRHLKEVSLIPLARIIGKWFSPTQLTIIGFIFGLLSCLFVIRRYYFIGNVLWLINRLFDGIDGVVARITNRQSDFGGYIDIVCDFIVYSLIPISLVYADPSDLSYLIVALLEGTFFVNAASQMYLSSILEKRAVGSLAQGEFTSATLPVGLIEGTETMLLITLSLIYPPYVNIFHAIFGLGVVVNIIYRIKWAHDNLHELKNFDI